MNHADKVSASDFFNTLLDRLTAIVKNLRLRGSMRVVFTAALGAMSSSAHGQECAR